MQIQIAKVNLNDQHTLDHPALRPVLGRLSGEDIPIAARITAIADVFDALVSPRSYKAAWPHSKALALMHEEAGKHFDPNLVACLEEVMDVVAKIYERFPDAEPVQASRDTAS